MILPRKLCLFASGEVGLAALKIVQSEGTKLAGIVISGCDVEEVNSSIIEVATCPVYLYEADYEQIKLVLQEYAVDIIILAWWPHILKEDLISVPTLGAMNFHPSFLPFGRGKNPYFWTFIDGSKFGVTIHWIDSTIDGGSIAFQKEIIVDECDNAADIYNRSRVAMGELFRENLTRILYGEIPKIQMNSGNYPLRYARNLEPNSEVFLDKQYNAGALIDLLKARSGFEKGGCWYDKDGQRYRITVSIEKD